MRMLCQYNVTDSTKLVSCHAVKLSLLQEYDNDAESVISNLAVNYDDDDLDIGKSAQTEQYGAGPASMKIIRKCDSCVRACGAAFKLAQVEVYRQRLTERSKRKWIAHEYGLIQDPAAATGKKKATAGRKLGPNDEQ